MAMHLIELPLKSNRYIKIVKRGSRWVETFNEVMVFFIHRREFNKLISVLRS